MFLLGVILPAPNAEMRGAFLEVVKEVNSGELAGDDMRKELASGAGLGNCPQPIDGGGLPRKASLEKLSFQVKGSGWTLWLRESRFES